MGKFAVKLLLLSFLAGFCIFFGMEAASRGIERIYGPMVPSAQMNELPEMRETVFPERTAPGESPLEKAEARAKREEERLRRAAEDGGLAEKTARLLQSAANGLIRFVAALFDRFV